MAEPLYSLQAALADRYTIERELGRGGMATVYLAHDLKHDRPVALKVLRPEFAQVVSAERFLREIGVTAKLAHPNILKLIDSGQAAGMLYYVMPYVEGGSLRERLNGEGRLPVEEALRIALEVADAVGYAHSLGIVHRDIKPENILFEANHAILGDFGIALALESTSRERLTEGPSPGTLEYMSPEQAGGSLALDGRSDLYSLGVVLYEMLTGEVPHTGPTKQAILAAVLSDSPVAPRTSRGEVSPELDRATLKALAKAPTDRFATAAELSTALQLSARSDVGAHERRSEQTTSAPLGRGLRRVLLRGSITLGAAVAVVLVVLKLPALLRIAGVQARKHYSDAPIWPAWDNIRAFHPSVFVSAGSLLVVQNTLDDSVLIFDGRRWTALPLPDSMRLAPAIGRTVSGKLLAIGTASGDRPVWLLSLTTSGLRKTDSLPPIPRDAIGFDWWSDGRELVSFGAAVGGLWRQAEHGWMQEPTGTTGMVSSVWGRDVTRRYATLMGLKDSLLVFDGIDWERTRIIRDTTATFSLGAALEDGASVVLGETCAEARDCRPFVLQQDSFDGSWREVVIPSGAGVPTRVTDAPSGRPSCHPLLFNGAYGRTHDDYFVWGNWASCDSLIQRHTRGCPLKQPCTWHVSDLRLLPVDELIGRSIIGMVSYRDTTYALAEDGTLWGRIGEHWRMVSGVPMSAAGQLAATNRFVFTSGNVFLQVFSDPSRAVSGSSLRELGQLTRLAARDTTLAALTVTGRVFVGGCRTSEFLSPTIGRIEIPRCGEWAQLPLPRERLTDIALLKGGGIVGVGPNGLAVSWTNGKLRTESVPREAVRDSLWRVVVDGDGTATAVGTHTVVRRPASGDWILARRLPAIPRMLPGPSRANYEVALLPKQELAVAGWGRILVWNTAPPDTDSLSLKALTVATNGPCCATTLGTEGRILLVGLPDGRLVAAFGFPHESKTAGWLQVWRPPLREDHYVRVDLPGDFDISGLVDDGRYLYVNGGTGLLRIPLDSLPFAAPQRRN